MVYPPSDFSFDYLSLIAGIVVFAIISVVAQKETEVRIFLKTACNIICHFHIKKEISYHHDEVKFKVDNFAHISNNSTLIFFISLHSNCGKVHFMSHLVWCVLYLQ